MGSLKGFPKCLAHEMRYSGRAVVQQRGIFASYDDVIISEYTSDLLIENQVIGELKGSAR